VIVSSVVMRGNTATGNGGAISNSGALTVRDSTIAGNTATGAGGGGVSATGTTLTIERSTITGNTAAMSVGGGVYHNVGSSNPLTITDSTIAGNSSSMSGGGFYYDTVARVTNSIVADNTAPSRPDVDGFNMTSDVQASYSLIEQPGGAPITLVGPNLTGVDPKLGPLADNGGPTPTLALLKGSPALDKGLSGATGDQRGATRPHNLKKISHAAGGNSADIGAYELVLCGGVTVNRVGTAGKDKLTGTKRADGILGLGGKDTLKGLKGKDGLCGGPGKDTLRGGPGKDTLLGGGGKDRLVGGGGQDREKQ
jgi:predicted outer membrane repeat protein